MVAPDALMTRQDSRATAAGLDLPSASVVVVGYNSIRYLERCFTALRGLDYPGELDLVFVENGAADGSAEFVRGSFPEVTVVVAEANGGYAAGNNLGAKHARGSILAFLNPDTEVDPAWLSELVRPLLADPTVGLTTSKILMMDNPGIINACGNSISMGGVTWCRGTGMPRDHFAADEEVPAVSGCAFAIWRSLFEEMEGFDERFFMYLEDTDISWRARVSGYRCVYVAGSEVLHDYKLKLSPWKMRLMEQNRYRMLAKHLSLRGILGIAPALAATEILTWGYATLNGPGYLAAKAKATFWALSQVRPVILTRWRPIEGDILREHQPVPPVISGVGGPFAARAQKIGGVITSVATGLSLRFLPGSRPGSRSSETEGPRSADHASHSSGVR